MKKIALVEPETAIKLNDSFTTLIDVFISAQDVKQSSRKTYRKALKRFMEWISKEEISTIRRSDS